MSNIDLIFLFVAFYTKHFIVDFPLQQPYQYLNKGTYGHPGGLMHAGLHSFASYIILVFWISQPLALLLSLVEGIAHYHIDWAKMNINKHFDWKCNETDNFWYLTGFDQYLHYLTYIAIVWWIV